MRRLSLLLVSVLALLVPLVVAGPSGAADEDHAARPGGRAVIESRTLGKSAGGRPIVGFHLGEPGKKKVLLISSMHGDELATRRLLRALRDGNPIKGIDLWIVPTYNPDGAAHHSRRNAHGVDLNRNYPYKWKRLTGHYYSGKKPASEPETRAMMAFLKEFRPQWIVSFHQPLHGIDKDTKKLAFSRRLSKALGLPMKRFSCGGACHGTMTMWFNHWFDGAAVTAEYGRKPSAKNLTKVAPGRLLRVFGATR